MNFPRNIAKSSVLASVIFWTIGLTEHFDFDMIPIMFISYIPIFLCCLFTIVFSICPFFWLAEKNGMDKRKVFFTFYPYYAIVCFALSATIIVTINFAVYAIAFFAAAFITTSQSWIWFAKESSL